MVRIHAETALLPDGWQADVEIAIGPDGRIDQVGPATGNAVIRVGAALPALVNLHSHTFQRAMAGRTERRGPAGQDSFWTWRKLMYRFLDRLTPDQVEAIAAQAFVEMAESGFGAVAEFHYLHHAPGGNRYADPAEMGARVLAAAAETGLGLTLLPVLYTYGGCDGRALEGGQLRFGSTPDDFVRMVEATRAHCAGAPADTVLGTAPHSLRAVDPTGLGIAAEAAGDGPIHIHAAEQAAELTEVVAHMGARPVQWLLEIGGADEQWCLIHATHMTPAETEGLARSGAVAGLCPITEANLGDGIFEGAAYLDHGGRLGVGSDSNVHISPWQELCLLEYGQRLRDRGRAVLAAPGQSTGRTLYDAALAGGAQAAGRDNGALAVGRVADIVGIDTGTAVLGGLSGDALLDALIFAGGGGAVREVWSDGRHIVTGGRHVARDAVAARFRAAMAALAADL